MKNQKGFTLIELLIIIALIGILSGMALSGFTVYRESAAYATVESTIGSARIAAEAGLSDPDNLPASVSLTQFTAQGPVTGVAGDYLVGMNVPKNMKFQVEYDPTCSTGACQAEMVQANHCFGAEYARWIRYGDGVSVLLENLSGAGCS